MDGKTKKIFFYLSVILITLSVTNSLETANKISIKGGILFEKINDYPVTINPPMLTFTRYLNTSTLEKGINQTIHYTKTYKNFCKALNKRVRESENITKVDTYFVSTEDIKLRDVEQYCLSKNARLPEIRDINAKEEIFLLAKLHGITYVPAGIIPDDKKYRYVFITDKQPINSYTTFDNFKSSRNGSYKSCMLSKFIACYQHDVKNNMIVYDKNPGEMGILQIETKLYDNRYKAICQNFATFEESQNNLLLRMAAHTCKRDLYSLEGMTEVVSEETNRFTRTKRSTTKNVTESHHSNTKFITLHNTYTEICKHVDNRNCSKFLNFSKTLFDFSKQLSLQFFISDIEISFYFIENLLSNFTLKNNTFYVCSTKSNIFSIEKSKLHFNLKIIIEFSFDLTSYCPNQTNGLNIQILNSELFKISAKDYLNNLFHNNLILETISDPSLPLSRHKRMILVPAIGGLVTTSSLYSTINGKPTFNWFGSLISKTTGLMHRDDFEETLQIMGNNTQMIHDLNINQEQLEIAYNNLGKELTRLNNINLQMEFSTATLLQEIDQKTTLRDIQTLIQLALLKVSSALGYGLNHQPSPYILSQEELSEIAMKHRARNIFLSDDMRDVKTDVYAVKGKLLFAFNIPVLEEKNLFDIYKATAIPIFVNGKCMKAKFETEYLAFSSYNNEYSVLTEFEFNKCRASRYCKAVDILRPLSSNDNCVSRTLESSTQSCDFEYSNSGPYYQLFQNILVYSVNGPLETKFKCKTAAETTDIIHFLNGLGTMKVAPDCQIFFQGKLRAYSNPEPSIQSLGEAKLMEVFHYMPNADQFKIVEPIFIEHESYPKLNLTKIKSVEILELVNQVLDPNQALPEIIRALIGICIVILFLVILCYCSPTFAVWFKTCIGCKNPTDWYTKYKHYDPRTFAKLAPSEIRLKCFDKLHKFRNKFGKRSSEEPGGEIAQDRWKEVQSPDLLNEFKRKEYIRHQEALLNYRINLNNPRLKRGNSMAPTTENNFEIPTTNYSTLRNDFKFNTQPSLYPNIIRSAPPKMPRTFDFSLPTQQPYNDDLNQKLERSHSDTSLRSIIINHELNEVYIPPKK